jgi:hypothetical protein
MSHFLNTGWEILMPHHNVTKVYIHLSHDEVSPFKIAK